MEYYSINIRSESAADEHRSIMLEAVELLRKERRAMSLPELAGRLGVGYTKMGRVLARYSKTLISITGVHRAIHVRLAAGLEAA